MKEFFSKPGEFRACGLFSRSHFVILLITICIICVALYFSRRKQKNEVKKTIQFITIGLWILEIIKIIFNFRIGNTKNPNTYVPLYFCSLILYAGIFSSSNNETLRKFGDVFISTGGIIAGICFLISPNTSLTVYPINHYISVQSFIFHGAMIYLGALMHITNYIEIEFKDIIYYISFITVMSIIAYTFNVIFDSNLMFISKNFPDTPVETIYNLTGKAFPIVMTLIQGLLPFIVVFKIREKYLSYNEYDTLMDSVKEQNG